MKRLAKQTTDFAFALGPWILSRGHKSEPPHQDTESLQQMKLLS